MISKIHAFGVITLFGIIAGGVAIGIVFATNDNNNHSDRYFNPKAPTGANGTVGINGTLIWSDEFDDANLNRDYWSVMTGGNGWGNNEKQVYVDSPDNIAIHDSTLAITAMKGNDGIYTSGRLMTRGSWFPGMSLPDGTIPTKIRFEALVTLPEAGQGIWPAFWSLSADDVYGGFANSGEIDIMELINEQTKLTQGIHYGGSGKDHKMQMSRTLPENITFSEGTHIFAVDWYPTKIVFFLDDIITTTFYSKSVSNSGWYSDSSNARENSPFDVGFKLIVNIAVGGGWPGDPDETTPDIATMFIEYVRVYADF